MDGEGIVPVRKGNFYAGFYAGISMYCHRKRDKEGFMIAEDGKIYRCPFGIWHLGDMVDDYNDGGWKARWTELMQVFRKSSIMSCNDCVRIANKYDKN